MKSKNVALITQIPSNHKTPYMNLALEGQGDIHSGDLCIGETQLFKSLHEHQTYQRSPVSSKAEMVKHLDLHLWISDFCHHRSPNDLFERLQGILESLKIKTNMRATVTI